MESTLLTFEQRLGQPWLKQENPARTLEDFRRIVASLRQPDKEPHSWAIMRPGAQSDRDYLLTLLARLALGHKVILAPAGCDRDKLTQIFTERDPLLQAEPPILLIPTGGSGGHLRFAVHPWSSIVVAVEAYLRFWQLQRINAVNLLPLYHVGGLIPCLRVFLSGGRLELADWQSLAAGQLPPAPGPDTQLSLVPTQLRRLLDLPDGANWLGHFAAVLIGGGPADFALLDQACQQGVPVCPAYGMTETAGTVALQKPEDFRLSRTIRGTPLPHWQVRVDDGQIYLRGEALCQGYRPLQQPWSCWFATGDNGNLDAQGYLRVTGRRDRIIISGGRKADPCLIEAALLKAGLGRAAWVAGLEDPDWGQRIAALLEGDSLPQTLIRERLKPHLPDWMVPRTLAWVQELPRNALGKIDKEACLRTLMSSCEANQSTSC